jgi:cytochrome b6-f complex iron-sulfur subunit
MTTVWVVALVVALVAVTITVAMLRRRGRDHAPGARGGRPVPETSGPGAPATAGGQPARAAATPVVRPDAVPARVHPTDQEIGVTRRQFFNRSLLAGAALGLSAFGASALAYLWPSSSAAGFGRKIAVGSVADVQAAFTKKEPYYNATAKTYMVPYPKADIPKAKKVANYAPVLAGMEQGYVALYQRCVHLGCRVPFCETSQWFECPCHGSKYNRVGERRGGPAPRGLDRFTFAISGGQIVVDTANIVIGPPVGTDTTGQSPEGAACV